MLNINILKEKSDFVTQCKLKEKELQKKGLFNEEENLTNQKDFHMVNDDFAYIKKGLLNFLKHWFCLRCVKHFTNLINKNFTNLKINKNINLKNIKGAIVTCNHISVVDSFAVRKAVSMDLHFVGAEFNNFKGTMGFFSRNSGYIPLPLDLKKEKMKKFNDAISYYLKKGKKILIYPEQSMWRDYKKPRPLKNGAFHYAVLNNVPILPTFITIKEKQIKVDNNGFQNFGDYTIHVLKPIYPKPELNAKENIEYLRKENYRVWKELYEKTYSIPLIYTTLDKSKIKI